MSKEDDRISALEARIESMQNEIDELRRLLRLMEHAVSEEVFKNL